MKKNQKIIIYLLSATYILAACTEFKVTEKDLFLKKIDLYEYFEPQSTVVTKTGFLTSFNKLVTNGDSLSCEIVKSNERYLSKIDFNGKIIWEKKAEQSIYYQEFSTQDEIGNFYNIFNTGNGTYQISVFDSTYKFQSIIELKRGSIQESGEYFKNITYWKNGTMLACGHVGLTKQSDGVIIAKPFFCMIDKSGIIKYKIIEENLPASAKMQFKMSEEGEISGIITVFNDGGKIKIKAMKLDKNLEIVKNNEVEVTTKNSSYPQMNLQFSKNDMHILLNDMATIQYLIVDQNLNFETFDLGPTFAQNSNFINGNTDDILISETAPNNFSKIIKLNKIGKLIEKEVILESIFSFNGASFQLQKEKFTINRLINTNISNKPNITFVKMQNKKESFNTLYDSQYRKYNCYHGR